MQTIALPYRTDAEGAALIARCRTVYACAVRTAYAAAVGADGAALSPRAQKTVRDRVKARLASGAVDAWTLHCATLEGMEMRRARPDGGAWCSAAAAICGAGNGGSSPAMNGRRAGCGR